MIYVRYGNKADTQYATVLGIKNPITVEGANEIICIKKALDRVVNPHKVLVKFEKQDV